MLITVNPWVVLYSIGIVTGLLLVLLFTTSHKRYGRHVQNVTAVLLILILLLFSEMAEEANIVDYYPFLINSTIALDLLIWPFLLFYVQYLIGKRNSYHWKDLLFFLPFIVGVIWQFPIITMPGEDQLSFGSNGIPTMIAFFVTFKFIIAMIFLGVLVKLLYDRIVLFKQLFQRNTKAKFIQRHFSFFTLLTICIFLIYTVFYANYFQLFRLTDSDNFGSLIITGIMLLMAINIFRNPQLIDPYQYAPNIKKFFNHNEDEYAQRLIQLFQNSHPYLNDAVAPDEIATELGLSVQQFSYLINRYLGISFSDLINAYRVKALQAQLQEQSEEKLNVLQAAYASGFSSKSSMNRIFKDFTGKTPSEYLNQIKEK